MVKVGITGGMGAGKSYICSLFEEEFNIPVFYSDDQTKRILDCDLDLKKEIKTLLGSAAYLEDDSLDRKYVSEKIFKDSKLRTNLQQIVYPYLWKEYDDWCDDHKSSPYTLFESAILVETGLYNEFDKIIVVSANMKIRIERLKMYRNISEKDAISRINTQTSEDARCKHADFIIKNDLHLNTTSLDWKERCEQELSEGKTVEEIDEHRRLNLRKRIQHIDHKIKYISYGGNNKE